MFFYRVDQLPLPNTNLIDPESRESLSANIYQTRNLQLKFRNILKWLGEESLEIND